MATAILNRVPHKLTVGTAKIGVVLPDEYASIASDVGVDKVVAGDTLDGSGRVSSLLRDGQAARIRIRYADTAGKKKTANILCDIDKYKTALASLVGKSFRGGTITSAFVPSRRRLG